MRCFESHTSPLPSPPWTPPSSHPDLHLCCLRLCYLHLCKKKYCIKLIFMYFLFTVDLSKFDSQYYNIRYIHSHLLNSGPWTETIKTSTLNIKQNKTSEQEALNIIPAPMRPTPPYLPPPSPLQHICLEFWNERKQKELCLKYVNNHLGFSIPEHMVWHLELKWLLHKSYWIFLNDLHTAMPLDSLLHFGIQLINIRY